MCTLRVVRRLHETFTRKISGKERRYVRVMARSAVPEEGDEASSNCADLGARTETWTEVLRAVCEFLAGESNVFATSGVCGNANTSRTMVVRDR